MKNFRSRRDFLFESCGGISGLGLAYLLQQDGLLAGRVVVFVGALRCKARWPRRSRISNRGRRQ